MSLANFQLQDIQFRFVSTKLEITDETGTVQTTVVVKQLQTCAKYLNLSTGGGYTAPWTPVPEFSTDDLDEDGEPIEPVLSTEELDEEETVDRIESAIHPENSS